MRKIFIFIALFIPVLTAGVALADNQCIECHSGWEEEGSPSHLFAKDIHHEKGLACNDCHGGDPTLDDMDDVRKSSDWKGVPDPKQIPQFCARCHSNPSYMVKHNPSLATDQLDKYKTSVHGQRLLGKGDTKVANCVSCHSVHDIQSPVIPTSTVNAFNIPATCGKCHANQEYMAEYKISTSQFDDFKKSVHGLALLEKHDAAAPACNDCHGNHGATPPGVTSLSAVCGECHALIADKFASSPHKAAFDENDYPECETCHSNHLIVPPKLEWIGTDDKAVCSNCHSDDDGTAGFTTARAMRESLTALGNAYDSAQQAVDDADEKGMMVVDERFLLKEVQQTVIESRTLVHTFNAGEVKTAADEGIEKAAQVTKAGLARIDDYYFRRKGLGIATLIITILAVLLWMKIKRLDN